MYNPDNYKQVDEQTRVWDLSQDITEFETVTKDHLINVMLKDDKDAQERMKDVDLRDAHPIWAQLLEDLKEGDILQYYIWKGGFLAYSEGYSVERDGKTIRDAAYRVS
jgi:hypothetical protein